MVYDKISGYRIKRFMPLYVFLRFFAIIKVAL